MKIEKKYTALTFDDGPNTTTTPKVIEKLKGYGVPASFFLVGDNITEESAAVARSAFECGCEICNHSKTHSAMCEQSDEEIRAEIEYTSAKITDICKKPPVFFRPPYIAVSENMHRVIDLTFICGVGANDWEESVSTSERANRILAQVENGTIILLHDMDGNQKTVDALDIIIPELFLRGYELVTVSGLFEKCGVKPKRGVMYTNVLKDGANTSRY